MTGHLLLVGAHMLVVETAGPLTTVQDLGRPGYAHLGVPRSGALDQPALLLGNRLVGNPATSAALEITIGPFTGTLPFAGTLSLTGAAAPLRVGGRPAPLNAPVPFRAGDRVEIGPAVAGLRCYLAVSGGFAPAAVLGSRATDTLSALGPPIVRAGTRLPIGTPSGPPSTVDVAPRPLLGGPVTLTLSWGPRADYFVSPAVLLTGEYTVSNDSNRVGARLTGPALTRAHQHELPSEGIVLGAVQVPASGQPLIFLADHPTTGGYPVVAVVTPTDLPLLAQARPGDTVRFVDLNSDLGEGFGIWTLGDDDALLQIVTSANVACGFHAGDPTTMRRVCARAVDLGVRIGAQVSYRDLAGFGRRRIDIDTTTLTDELRYQIGALSAFGPISYVKPHGALYNTAATDPSHAAAVVAAALATPSAPTTATSTPGFEAAPTAGAEAAPTPGAAPGFGAAPTAGAETASAPGAMSGAGVAPTVGIVPRAGVAPSAVSGAGAASGAVTGSGVEVMTAFGAGAVSRVGLPVLCQPGSVLARLAAEAGLRVIGEGFVDRGYLPDGRLVPRGAEGAVLTDVAAVAERALRMARDGEVIAVDGSVLSLPFESLCVHGDTPGAVTMASAVRATLLAAGIPLTPFV